MKSAVVSLVAIVVVSIGCEDAGSPASVAGPAAPRPLEDAGVVVPVPAADGGAEDATPYPVPDWATEAPEAQGLDSSKLEAANDIAAADGSYCLLVIRHGVLVSERYWNGSTAASANPSWSIAKSYASTLVGIAIDRGDLESLDESAADFVPEWKGTEREAITLRNLVSMTSGLKWSAFEDYVELATIAQDQTTFAVTQPLADPPGSKWTYDNGGVQILERVFRSATGGTIEQYAEAHLWSKIGAHATWGHDPSGNSTAYANVLTTCRDHARLGYLFLHGGQWAGTSVVSPGYVKTAITPSQNINRAYGLLWWLNGEAPAEDAMMQKWIGRMVPFAPTDLFAARGFGNQFIDVIPSLDLVVVRFGRDPKDPSAPFDPVALAVDSRFEKHDKILAAILEAIRE
ncbi:MAG: serine hydrolase [Polyangiaceae bacterium]